MNPFDVTNKHFLITGGSSGIGKACVEMALGMGATVTTIGRNQAVLEEMQTNSKGRLHYFIVDLSDDNEVRKFAEKKLPQLAPFNGFIHSAGVSPSIPVSRLKTADLTNTVQVNVFSAIHISRGLVKTSKKTMDSIVYITSVMANLGEKAKSAYGMSKAALEGFSRSQSLEYARFNIRVNTIAPAVVNTMLSQKAVYRSSEEKLKYVVDKHPLGLGEPQDIASTAIFLLSNGAKWITGSTLTVDGGYSIQ